LNFILFVGLYAIFAVNMMFLVLFRWRRWLQLDCRQKLWHFYGSIYKQLESSCYRKLFSAMVKAFVTGNLSWIEWSWDCLFVEHCHAYLSANHFLHSLKMQQQFMILAFRDQCY